MENISETMDEGKRITVKWLYSWGWSASAAAEECKVSRTHLTLCLKGDRQMSEELRRKVLALPKRPAVRGKYIKCS